MILVPYQPHHIDLLELRDHDIGSLTCIGNSVESLKLLHKYGPAYTGIHNGEIVGIAGVVLFWKRVGEVWLVGSNKLTECKLSFHKSVIRGLSMVASGLGMHRMQGIVPIKYPNNIKWLEKIGFEYEGMLEKYGVDGSDCVIMKRIFQWQ